MRACTRAKGHVREAMKTRRDDDHEDQKWAHVDRAPTRGLRCAQVTSNGAPQKATRGRPLNGDPAVSEPAERDLMNVECSKDKITHTRKSHNFHWKLCGCRVVCRPEVCSIGRTWC